MYEIMVIIDYYPFHCGYRFITYPLKVNKIIFQAMPFCQELVHITASKVLGQQHYVCLSIVFELLMFPSTLK